MSAGNTISRPVLLPGEKLLPKTPELTFPEKNHHGDKPLPSFSTALLVSNASLVANDNLCGGANDDPFFGTPSLCGGADTSLQHKRRPSHPLPIDLKFDAMPARMMFPCREIANYLRLGEIERRFRRKIDFRPLEDLLRRAATCFDVMHDVINDQPLSLPAGGSDLRLQSQLLTQSKLFR